IIPSENASPTQPDGFLGSYLKDSATGSLDFTRDDGSCGSAIYQITRIAQQLGSRNVLGELRAQESFIRGIFKEATHQIRHSRQQFAYWRIFPDAIIHLDQRALDRTCHSVA